jgi:hypothetical protein
MEQNEYPKMKEFIETIWSSFHVIKEQAKIQKDKKLEMISLVIFNYVSHQAKIHGYKFEDLHKENVINLIPFFEYVTFKNIKLFDMKTVNMNDVDVTNKADLEKYTLSLIYDISQ